MSAFAQREIVILIGLFQAFGLLLAVIFLVVHYARSRSVLLLAVAVVTTGAFLWALHHPMWTHDRVQQEVDNACVSSTGIRTC